MTDSHLTEDERQAIADGTLSRAENPAAFAHIEQCAACADDVARIGALMTRAKEAGTSPVDLGDLWPTIRGRIEQTKVVQFGGPPPVVVRSRRRLWIIGSLAAAAVVGFIILRPKSITKDQLDSVPSIAESEISLASATDSARIYEQEAQELLSHLELQRAMMRPEVAKAFDRDIRVVDDAIAELKTEIARQPGNVALLRLLAASYHRKIDLLTRAGNATG